MANGDFRPPGGSVTLEPIELKFGIMDYVGNPIPQAKTGLRQFTGVRWGRGENVGLTSRAFSISLVHSSLIFYRVPRGPWLDAQCTSKRVSVVSRFQAYDFVPRVNAPIYTQKTPFWGQLKLNPTESAFANFSTTDKAIITKLDQNIKLIKLYINH